MTVDPATAPVPDAVEAPWSLAPEELAERLDADLAAGIDPDEAASRLERHGPNRLAEPPGRPAWKRLAAQFTDLLILILIGAAVVSFVINRELKTPIVVLLVVVLNAVIGFVQEGRAERSLDALKQMMVATARVRRGGRLIDVPAEEVVPGDIALIEAGDRVPADGRLLLATNLEIEEASLTGESQPAPKDATAIDEATVPVGDRADLAFMNTTVTRGRGELLVYATGMQTEIGRIAGLLASTEEDETPLQRQLHDLARSLAKLAGVVVLAVVAIGLARGQEAGDLFNTAVALAVASIPEGLPAVTAVTLALGVQRMAKRNAIVKKLAGVETLGCTSVICTDKTGTLTLSEMTARALVLGEATHRVSGEGYDATDGEIEGVDPATLVHVLEPLALCNDASVRDGVLVGDPTEGALLTLAAKGGVEVDELRTSRPRLAEVPFDSANKYMATAHRAAPRDVDGDDDVRLYVKGAPDVVLARTARVLDEHGEVHEVDEVRERVAAANEALAAEGLRVLAIAERHIDPDDVSSDDADHLDGLVIDLTLLALVGIVDPPRPEARDAIAEAHSAGISVRMITGDHAVTASAIGAELGLEGRTVTGAELDDLDDEALGAQLDEITVFARVAPEHKLRLVTMLRDRGEVVAMTGDGVNDAPALKRSDMGVAMGITGTEVTKEAATMVLADDNFATIVRAVEQGRAIYGNIVNFVRFQLTTTLGFAVLFLLASAFDIAGGAPFTAVAILWVNLIMDGPPAMALGVDEAEPDIMDRPPRPIDEKILTPRRWFTIGQAAVIMALGTLAVLEWAPGDVPRAGVASVGGTMAFTTFVLFQFFNILSARSDQRTVFDRRTFGNRFLWLALAGVLILQVGVVHLGPLQRLFDTTSLSLEQWLVSIAVATTVLWAEEIRKAIARRTAPIVA